MENRKIGITGHQNIPSEAIEYVRSNMINLVEKYDNKVTCLSSLAVGSDQLFAEIVLNKSGILHSIIPCKNYEDTFKKKVDLDKFKNLVNNSEKVEFLNYENPSEEAFLYAGYKVVDKSDIIIAVWDGEKSRGKGGTGDIVEYAKNEKKEVVILWPEGVKRL